MTQTNDPLRQASNNLDEAYAQVEDMEHYVTHEVGAEGEGTYPMAPNGYWRCFQCGETFKADQEEAARKHFGTLPPSMPACWYGKDELVTLLRVYEEQNRTLLTLVMELTARIEDDE